VTTVAVSDEFKKKRTLFFVDGPVTSELDGLLGSEDVHSVDLKTRDFVAASEVLGVRRATSSRSTHSVLIVLADKDHREVPELSLDNGQPSTEIGSNRHTHHVEGFENLTLIARTVTIQ